MRKELSTLDIECGLLAAQFGLKNNDIRLPMGKKSVPKSTVKSKSPLKNKKK